MSIVNEFNEVRRKRMLSIRAAANESGIPYVTLYALIKTNHRNPSEVTELKMRRFICGYDGAGPK